MNSTLRIIDTNLNRCREALRVMEEYARFVLDDALLSEECKAVRHDLAGAVRSFEESLGASGGEPVLIAHRDIVGDVGRTISTASESSREQVSDVALAAGKRLSEGLRAIEEYGKVLDASFASAVEALRYRGYELERRIALTARSRTRLGDLKLYVIITSALCHRDWLETACAALDGGADCLQLREKDVPDRELLERAKQLSELCHDRGKLFIVNDRPDIAVAAKAHGVHLGQDDVPITVARRMMPREAIVGISTHNEEQIRRAAIEAPDYMAVGPMFPTKTKPQDHIATPQLLTRAKSLTATPIVAIGGITLENAGEVLAAGADCLCVCAAVISDSDPDSAVRRFRETIEVRSPVSTR